MTTSLIPDKPSTPKEDQGSKNLKDNWVKCGNINLDLRDKNTITSGKKMTDMHINAAQQLLKRQFKNINGLQSTLLQKKLPLESIENAIQILHVRNDHWAVVTTVGLTEKEKNYLRYYDSAYSTLFEDTEQVIVQLFGPSRFQQHTLNVQIMVTPRQFGSTDCGLYAIAVSTAIAHGIDPSNQVFTQEEMRPHFVECLESQCLKSFPVQKKHRVKNPVITLKTIYLCPVCNKPDFGEKMVGCDQCYDWYHDSCVPPYNPEEEWYCNKCIQNIHA